SQVRYWSDYGAMKVTETTTSLKFEFFAVGSNSSVDDYTLEKVLPVELTIFNAHLIGNSSVHLNWSTATELNNYGFDIERSGNNTGWEKIGFVAGHGNSNSPHSYTFNDSPDGGTTFNYRLKQIDFDGEFKYYDAITINLSELSSAKLLQNAPNPFNPSTAIKFYVPTTEDVTIKIYDILGREIKTLLDKQTEAGYHVVYWNGNNTRGENVSSGIYLYRLTAGSFSQTKKMNLLK
ncbi:MAG TPA: T9SS type A sorting domain-containing protein, partial [Ignavibacteriaceae bacterium]|nr:T9SS type A sorting domain-containing protein [Ignavibacteriaceae bacterium]